MSMKKKLSILFLMVALMFASVLMPQTVQAKTVKLKGKYYQTDARKMLSRINSFRTGKEAWYYKTEGSNAKVKVKNLKKLKYDYKLEKITMQRAAEIVVSFDHTRPNGQSCFSAYPSSYRAAGKNLAMGTAYYMTVAETMDLWKETQYSYNGQGHRRNMLSKYFTCVGVACYDFLSVNPIYHFDLSTYSNKQDSTW